VTEQEPRLDQHVVGRHEPLVLPEDLLRARVAPVTAIGGRIEHRRVDEERQRAEATASVT
jgi:hypothetical protein